MEDRNSQNVVFFCYPSLLRAPCAPEDELLDAQVVCVCMTVAR